MNIQKDLPIIILVLLFLIGVQVIQDKKALNGVREKLTEFWRWLQ